MPKTDLMSEEDRLRRDAVALNAAMGTAAVVLRRRLDEELCDWTCLHI